MLIAVMLTVAPAHADESAAEDEAAAKRDAKILLDEGNEHLRAGQPDAALGKYRAAFDTFASPKIRLNMAAALKELGDTAGAHAEYSRFLETADDNPDLFERVRSEQRALEPMLARISVQSSVEGAEVFIDDEPKGVTPIDAIVVNPGARRVRVELVGYRPFAEDLVVSAATTAVVRAELVPDVAPTVVATTTPDDDDESVVEQWWFWAVVGTVVIGASVGIAVAASSSSDPWTPNGELGNSGTSSWDMF